ncbi:MAG: hypothetical protein JWO97_2641 [Acidobacteria bacterium]|nr:hypothetical protein [Acidobacteriota bacterium]
MDLITIKFIGLVLLFHTFGTNGKVNYTMFAVDATPGDDTHVVKVCDADIPEHHAYLRIVGDAVSAIWESKTAIPCETEGPDPHKDHCLLYELDHDDLTITGVSTLDDGVAVTASLGLVPRLKKFFGTTTTPKLIATKAHDNSAATLTIKTGQLAGIPEFNDMRTMMLNVPQPEVHIDEVTIESTTRANHRIVVPAGAQIAIINMMKHDAIDKPGNHSSAGGEKDWYLHFKLLDKEPPPGECKHPISKMKLRLEHSHDSSHPESLNKACSATTYP